MPGGRGGAKTKTQKPHDGDETKLQHGFPGQTHPQGFFVYSHTLHLSIASIETMTV